MKIAYDSQIFHEQTFGGISRYFCEIASRIAQEPDVHVAIIAPMHSNAYLAHMPQGIVCGFRAPQTDWFQRSHSTNLTRMMMRGLGLLVDDLMLRAMNPDIVHDTYFSPYQPGSRRARRVLTIHDMIHEKFASSFPRTDKTARYKAMAAERADHIICVSKSTQRDVLEILGLPIEKTSIIYHGFKLMNTAVGSTEACLLPTKKPFLLYVGNRRGYKNFSRLLEVYGMSTQLKKRFKLVCFGGGAFHEDELRTMKRLECDNGHVLQLTGDDQLLAKLYKHAGALIYPSLYEGFGMPPLEAMLYNCPVVCSNTSSIPEVVGDAGEYFDPKDIESMRVAIERVVESENHREMLLAKSHARLECFSWDRCAAETLNVYMKLA